MKKKLFFVIGYLFITNYIVGSELTFGISRHGKPEEVYNLYELIVKKLQEGLESKVKL